MEEISDKTQRIYRVIFSSLFLVFLSIFMFETSTDNVLAEGVCIKDRSFEFTDGWNTFLRDHVEIKKRYIIFASTLMDVMLVSFVVYYFFKFWSSYRIIIAYIIFFSTRALLQVSITIIISFLESILYDKVGRIHIRASWGAFNYNSISRYK